VQLLDFDSSISSIGAISSSIEGRRLSKDVLRSSSRLLRKIPSRLLTWTLLALAVLPWLGHSSQNRHARSLQKSLQVLVRDHRQLLAALERLGDEMSQTSRLARQTELANKELAGVLASASASSALDRSDDASDDGEESAPHTLSLYGEAEDLENAYLERIEHMEESIRARSLQRIVQSYPQYLVTINDNRGGGGSKLYLRIRLEAREWGVAGNVTADHSRNEPAALILETEPVDSMPHAIDYFLRLAVEAQHYSGGGFALIHQPSVATASSRRTLAAGRTHRIHTVVRHHQPSQQRGPPGQLTERRQNEQRVIQERGENRTSDDSWDLARGMAFAERGGSGQGDGLLRRPRVGKYSVVFHRSGGRHGEMGGGTGLHHDVAVGPHFAIHMAATQVDNSPLSAQHDGEGSEVEKYHDPEDDWDHGDDVCFGRIVAGHDVLDRMVEASRATGRQQLIGMEAVELLLPDAVNGLDKLM
jgi:hypothetical protein